MNGGFSRERLEEKTSYLRERVDKLSKIAAGKNEAELAAFLAEEINFAGVKYMLQTAIQAVIDSAYHLCAKVYHRAPESAVDALIILRDQGALTEGQFQALVPMVKFRTRVVHGYEDVTAAAVTDILRGHLGDFAVWGEVLGRLLNVAEN